MALTPAGDIKESATLTQYSTSPVLVPTSGEGAVGDLVENEDFVAVTAVNVLNSVYYVGPRLPTTAKVKKVQMYGIGIDSNATEAAKYDVNLIFSDAPVGGLAGNAPVLDGTSVSLANQIPTTALNGTVTSIPTYASPNKMFGTAIAPVNNSGAFKLQELTHVGTFTFAMRQIPLWSVLGFAQDPGGYLNFFIVESTAAGTAAAGTLGMIVDYVV